MIKKERKISFCLLGDAATGPEVVEPLGAEEPEEVGGLGGVVQGHHPHAAGAAEALGLAPGHGAGAAAPRDVVAAALVLVVGVAGAAAAAAGLEVIGVNLVASRRERRKR